LKNDRDNRSGAPRERLTRRELIERSAAFGAFLSVPALIAACGGGGGGQETAPSPPAASTGGAPSASTSASTTPAAGAPKRGGKLRVGLNDGGATDTLSPWNIPSYNSDARAEQVYERLYKYDANGAPAPRLAESADSNADATVWQVKIQSGVTFHDGKTLTADDVLYSFRYVADEKNKAESLARLEPIDLAASKKVSDTEIEFHLKRPIGDFPGLLSEKALWIVPDGATEFTKKPNGTGPFTFVEWQPGVRALYKRNPNYWQSGKPYVDEVEILIITDPAARLNALLGAQVDEITFVDFVQAKAQEGNAAIQIVNAAQPQTNPFYVQLDAPPYTDNRIREALKLAVDREAMVQKVELGFGTVGNDLFGKGLPSYNDALPQRQYDPEKAASLLKAAGHYPFTLPLPSSAALPGMLESATAYKEQAKAAGITVQLQKLDAGSYFANDKYLKSPTYQTNWGQSFESQAQDGLFKDSPYNETHWYSKTWAEGFRKAQAIPDADKRNAAYKDLQVPLYKEGGYVVFAFFNTLDAASSKVMGIVPNIASGYENLGGFDFKDHWFAP
jgi:peptide/nickel transport system substrate-binding protein